jgi:hypothetical protein
MSMEFKSPTRKRSEASKRAAKDRRAEKSLSQTQEEAEASRSQNRERMNASRELKSQEKTEARRGQERERSSASRELESQAKTEARRGQKRERSSASRELESQEETAARRGLNSERTAASRCIETLAVTTARQRQDQSLTAARRARGLEETIEMRRREADLVTDIEDSLADLSAEPPINVLEAFESDARIARMLFWENSGVYRFDSLESNATEEEKQRLHVQLKAATVSTEILGRCWDNYYKEMDPSQELHICAVCYGRRYEMAKCKNGGIMSLFELTLLKVDIEKVAEYERKTDDMKRAYNYYKSFDGTLYHLIPFLVQEISIGRAGPITSVVHGFPVCKQCSKNQRTKFQSILWLMVMTMAIHEKFLVVT